MLEPPLLQFIQRTLTFCSLYQLSSYPSSSQPITRPWLSFQQRSFPRAIFRASSNFFLVLRGFGDPSLCSVLIYPLHFLANSITLILIIIYTEPSTHVKLTQSPSFEESHKLAFIFIICGLGLLNIAMLPFFAYKNIHSIIIKMYKNCSSHRETTYIVSGRRSVFTRESAV